MGWWFSKESPFVDVNGKKIYEGMLLQGIRRQYEVFFDGIWNPMEVYPDEVFEIIK